MRQLLAVLLLIFGASAALAQEGGPAPSPAKGVCALSVAQVPGIGALKLGMTAQQVLALFPGSGEDPEVRAGLAKPANALGVSSFVIKPDRYQSKEKSAGVSQIILTLLDGRVTSFYIGYNGPEWPHVDKFVAKVVEGTNLPPAEAWEAYAGLDTQLKTLTCTDFEIRVFAGGQGGSLNYVVMNDLEAARTLKERRVKAREKMKQESKP